MAKQQITLRQKNIARLLQERRKRLKAKLHIVTRKKKKRY